MPSFYERMSFYEELEDILDQYPNIVLRKMTSVVPGNADFSKSWAWISDEERDLAYKNSSGWVVAIADGVINVTMKYFYGYSLETIIDYVKAANVKL